MDSSRAKSARQRLPSGRSNANDFVASNLFEIQRPKTAALVEKEAMDSKPSRRGPTKWTKPGTDIVFRHDYDAVSSAAASITLSSEHADKLNDPLHVFKKHTFDKRRNQVLLGPQYPTLPPPADIPQRKYPLTCPESWLTRNQERDWYETADQTAVIDTEAKMKVTRDFVERNQDRMWKYDINYLHRSPRYVAEQILEDPGFLGKIEYFHSHEREINLSNSEKTLQCLRDGHLNSTVQPVKDLTLASLTTSRSERQARIQKLLLPATNQALKKFNRGYVHDGEFKNFSTYNSILKTNKGAILNR